MDRAGAPLEGTRAIGRLGADGPWIGFGYRAGVPRLVVGAADGTHDAPADGDLLLALAIAHFAEAFDEGPPDFEATQSDLSALVRHLMGTETEAGRSVLLGEAMDAIDDGLAGDAVAERLAAARSPATTSLDPVELLVLEARQLAERG
jgi:hypothetical protein